MTAGVRLRRSALFMPGANARALDKARTLPADVLILDLEDAVAPDAKPAAREQVMAAIRAGGYGPREVVVRVNGYGSQWWDADLRAVCASGADAMLVPKIDSADQVSKFGDLMAINNAPPAMALWVMAETPAAVWNIESIAGADPRLAVIVMGTSDLGKALRLPADPARAGLLHALSTCVLAARAHGLDILDGVYGDIADGSGFARACAQGRQLGFDGKTLIHPAQIDAANEAFGVSGEARDRAAAIVRAWDEAARQSRGIAVLDGQMIEHLHAEEARRLLDLAAAIDAREPGGADEKEH